VSLRAMDADGDGSTEYLLQAQRLEMIIDPNDSGAITAWDVPQAKVNLLDTLHRHHEPYHDQLRNKAWRPAGSPGEQAMRRDEQAIVREMPLVFDRTRRMAFVDYLLGQMPHLESFVAGAWRDEQQDQSAPYRVDQAVAGKSAWVALSRQAGSGLAKKRIEIDESGARVRCVYELPASAWAAAALEFNLGLRDARFMQTAGQLESVSEFSIAETGLGLSVLVQVQPAARLLHAPIETVSESEAGLERSYQGLSLLWCWELAQNRAWKAQMTWTVSVDGQHKARAKPASKSSAHRLARRS
jgi:alpha-amylase